MRRKRVLQISNYYYPEIGGIEKIAQAITDSVSEFYDVKIICFTHKKDDRTDKVDGAQVIRCGTKLMISSQQLSFEYPKKLKKVIDSFNPDIVILHAPNPFTEFFTLKYLKPNMKFIVYWHSDIVKQKVGDALFQSLQMKLLDRADAIVATSPNYIKGSKYLSRFAQKCTVVPNCIDENGLAVTGEIAKKSLEIRNENKGKTICCCVGRQVPYKGFEYVVQAMRQLDSNFVLYLIGRKGESTPEIAKLSEGMRNVVMLGEADNSTLIAYLNACDIFCFPSITKNEAFGIALAEGMYFNKPAITFTIPGSGVNYVSIDGQTGIEVANKDVKAYANAMRKIGSDVALRKKLGDAAGQRVRDLFLEREFADNIKTLFTNI